MKNSYLKISLILLILAGMLTSTFYSCAKKSVDRQIARIQQQDLPGLFASKDCLFYGCKYIDSTLKAEEDGGFSGTVTFQRNNQNYTRELRIYHRENLRTAIIVIDNDYANNLRHLEEDADLLYDMFQTDHPEDLSDWQLQTAQAIAPGVLSCVLLNKAGASRVLKLQVSESTAENGIPVISCTALK